MKKLFILLFLVSAINTKAQCWSEISSGTNHSIAIKTNGTLWTWGYNNHGQLGDSSNLGSNVPKQIGSQTNWLKISAGGDHSMAIKTDGTLWCWGDNGFGQIGNGTNSDKFFPVQIGTANDWIEISAGSNFSIAKKVNGTLWAWGNNDVGQLGDSTIFNKNAPIQVGTSNQWNKISAGLLHSLATKTDGTLWGWGWNDHGQLGDSTSNLEIIVPTQIGNSNDWDKISASPGAGASSSYSIKTDGSLWAWGDNSNGQLGIGNFQGDFIYPVQVGNSNDWDIVTGGTTSAYAIKTNGTLWAWGSGGSGSNLGNGANTQVSSPVQIGNSNNWKKLCHGTYNTFAITNSGNLWDWGLNNEGQLGNGNYGDVSIPTLIHYPISANISTGTSYYCSGGSFNSTFSTQECFGSGNIFTAQLSDASGNFNFPVNIGSVISSATSGAIACTIPSNALNGNGYRVRVVSSNPLIIGNDNGSNIIINGSLPQITFSASPQIGSAPLYTAINNTTPNRTSYSWLWTFGDGTTATSNASTVFHSYTYPGMYDVSVVATSTATGCSDTLYQQGYIFAIGNPCTHSASVTPSGIVTLCTGNSLTANTGANYTYQWNINGVAIPGAISVNYQPTQSGYYSVTVMDNGCPVTSDSTLVTLVPGPPPPVITASGSIQSCTGGTVTLTASGASPGHYLWNTGATSDSITVYTSGSYYVSISDSSTGCISNSTPYTLNVSNVPPPAICVITVDSLSKFNVLSWDKTPYGSKDTFVVYRDVANNNYQKIGKVSYDSISQFVDTASTLFAANGDPNVASWRYKLSVIDSCGTESSLSPFHQTIFLQNNGGNFSWNHYQIEGQITPVPTLQNYVIYRDNISNGNWQPIQTLSAQSTAYTDPNFSVFQNTASYRVETVWNISCDPSRGIINTTRSNVRNVAAPLITGLNSEIAHNLAIFPNPAKDNLTVDLTVKENTKMLLHLVDMDGRELMHTQRVLSAGRNLETLNITQLASGIYFIQLQVGEQTLRAKVLKEN